MQLSKRNKSQKAKATTSEKASEEMVRLNVNISKTFYKQVKQKALDLDVTVKDVVVEALKIYLSIK